MKIKILTVTVAALLAATTFGGGKKGSSYGNAKSLSSSQTATLVPEWDSEEKEEFDNGVAYYKVTLSRGQAYTIWITGGNAANIDLDVFTNDEYYDDREDEPYAGFDVDEIDGGATKFAYLYADDWDMEEDPKSGRYIVELDGEIGQQTQLYFQRGIRVFDKVGTDTSPKVLSFSTGWKTYSAKMIDGEYHINASLKAGNKYRVYLRGGKNGAALGFDVDSLDEDADAPAVYADEAYENAYNTAMVIVPEVSGKHRFALDGDTSQSFQFHYKRIPARAIASHVSIPLIPENDYTAKFVPGRIADNDNYYDDIIDERLCRIYLAKGERWVFETQGADKEIEMRAYDPSGKILATNDSADGYGTDTRLVVTASSSGVYYVGVCDPALDVKDLPTGASVTLTARNTADMMAADSWDPVDDTYKGATKLVTCPDGTNQVLDASAFVSGPHRLAANDLYDCYAIDCRKNGVYSFQASYAVPEALNNFTLASKVFYIVDGKEKTIATTGSVSPVEVSHDAALTFKSPISGVVYLRVWVEDGKGLDYTDYDMLASVSNSVPQMGLVTFEGVGAAGTFSLNAETVKYPAGSTLALSPNANLKVVFNAPSGYTVAPASTNIVVPAYADGDEPVKVTAKYTDVYDVKYQTGTKTVTKNGKKTTTKLYSPEDGDATPAGAFAITPAYATATAKRTLWADDPADTFVFTASTNVYYDLRLADVTGDAKMTVSNVLAGVVFEGDELVKSLLPTGKTYVVVSHAETTPADGTYAFVYGRAAGGTVKFSASSYTATEGAEYATLTVKRTGSEGAVKARYYTEAATALPGTNYYPVTDGVVSWKNGDKADKTVKIKLIPALKAEWAASNLFFNVKLAPVDEFGLADDEYLARLGTSTAKVTIKESSSKTPGTISLASVETVGDPVPVANAKKPAVSVTAGALKADGGTPALLTFSRTGGTSGKVSVKVSYVANKSDTAKSGTDFSVTATTLTWEDGDAEPKQMPLTVFKRAANDFTVSRKFTLTMAVVKTGFTPTLAAKTATVSIMNDTAAQTAAAYAKTIPAASGVKLAATGSWFTDGEGALRSGNANGTTTFTLTGPGLFVCEPTVVIGDAETDAAKLTCQFNKEAAVNVADFGGRIVRIVPSGTTTVKFALTGVKGSAFARFEPQADGRPYVFIPFKGAAPTWPMNKAVVESGLAELGWSLADGLAGFDGLYTRVRFGTASKPTAVIASGDTALDVATIPDALVAGKTYYWAVDYAYTNATGLAAEELAALKWTSGPATWSFSVLKDGAPVSRVSAGTDAAGNDVASLVESGEPVELIQCLKPDLALAGEGSAGMLANKFRLVGGKLPTGVSISGTTGKLTGCPTAAGTFTALLQSYNDTAKTVTKNGKKTTTHTYTYGTTIPVTFNVLPAGTALGSWRGSVVEDGATFPADSRGNGVVTLSASSAGKLTAKVTIAGVAYTFTGTTGYDELVDRTEDPLAGDVRRFRVALKNTTTIAKKKYTNYMWLEVDDGAVTNGVALANAKASVELLMQVSNAKKTGVTADIAFTGEMIRNSGSTVLGKEALADFAGYYTVGLVPFGVSAADGVPTGDGYLTLTVGSTGSVKFSGVLADGTSVSFSSFGMLVGDDLASPHACKLLIPVGVAKSSYALSGFLALGYESEDAECAVALPGDHLLWVRNASTAVTRDGTGFAMELAPTGGWYDKVVNLQAYYLDRGFSILAADDPGDLPIEALASGYSFLTSAAVQEFLPTPDDLAMRFTGNTAKIDARKLVKNKTTGLYDFTQSVNPWNTTIKFTRATGVFSGKFSAWEWVFKHDDIQDFANKQKEIKSLPYKGVWLYSRDTSSESPLRDDAVSAGYFQMPTSGKWKASLPFNVVAEPVDNEWFETEEP